MKPLAGIRVLDLTRVLAGPYCTALLADLGAEIIKLEPPHGDDYRHIGPFRGGESALFTLSNRGKRSIALNLKDARGLDAALALADRCDVVVENFRPGVADKIGLGATALRARNPALVYCSISGFGQDGPFRDLPAYDLVVQAMSGLMAATGEDGGEPLKSGESLADINAGLYAGWAILAALLGRERGGDGATLDIAMYDVLYSMLTTSHAQYFYGETLPQRVGNRHPLSTPFGCYHCRDGQVVIAVLSGPQFARFAELIGHPGLEADPGYATDTARTQNELALRTLIEGWSSSRSVSEAVESLAGACIASAPIWDIAQATDNDHTRTRGLVSALPHPVLGHAPTVGQAARFNGEKPVSQRSAPGLGADGADILTGICGYDSGAIEALCTAGVLVEEAARI